MSQKNWLRFAFAVNLPKCNFSFSSLNATVCDLDSVTEFGFKKSDCLHRANVLLKMKMKEHVRELSFGEQLHCISSILQ